MTLLLKGLHQVRGGGFWCEKFLRIVSEFEETFFVTEKIFLSLVCVFPFGRGGIDRHPADGVFDGRRVAMVV